MSRLFILTLMAMVLFGGSAEARSGCREVTLREALTNNHADVLKGTNSIGEGLFGTLGSGLLLYAERNGKTEVLIGSVLLFSKEFYEFLHSVPEFAASASNGRQLNKFNGLDPDSIVESCPATGTLASTLGFKTLTILKPKPPFFPGKKSPPAIGSAFQRNILGQIGQLPSSTLAPRKPANVPGLAPAAMPPWWHDAPAGFVGTVRDRLSGQSLSSAYVTLVGLSNTQGAAPGVFTQNDGSFEFNYIPAGKYVLWVSKPGYAGSSAIVDVPGRTNVSLYRVPAYPCDFTVFNTTDWPILVGPGARFVSIPPHQSYTAKLNYPDKFFARAQSVYGSLFWGPIPGQCGGPGYINIVP
ncbi:MAG: carboxypeptidase-like regulatory domain-containing protein [Syntrophobacteraceae bacterium]|nr:carboxypeptidase-like regulatory domain-containing protein [Syntrophobacteraceae bacterium]